ncbi:MAG: DUF4244 domain-containing protein [Acidimicrobiia bacterium]
MSLVTRLYLIARLRLHQSSLVERLHARVVQAQVGQATAEYALVILGAVAVAGLLVAWATQSRAVDRLFDLVVGRVVKAAR